MTFSPYILLLILGPMLVTYVVVNILIRWSNNQKKVRPPRQVNFEPLTTKQKADLVLKYSDQQLFEEIKRHFIKQHGIILKEDQLSDVINLILDGVDFNGWKESGTTLL